MEWTPQRTQAEQLGALDQRRAGAGTDTTTISRSQHPTTPAHVKASSKQRIDTEDAGLYARPCGWIGSGRLYPVGNDVGGIEHGLPSMR